MDKQMRLTPRGLRHLVAAATPMAAETLRLTADPTCERRIDRRDLAETRARDPVRPISV